MVDTGHGSALLGGGQRVIPGDRLLPGDAPHRLGRHGADVTRLSSIGERSCHTPLMNGPRVCSVARTLEIVGERWSLLVLREVALGVRRFDAIGAATGASRAVLADRLRVLVAAGLLVRREYRDTGVRARLVCDDGHLLDDDGRELRAYPNSAFSSP